MKTSILLFHFFCFLSVASASVLNWEALTELPAPEGLEKNIGVAGPFVGVHNDALIVAGGANFPDKPLWDTDKVWHDKIYVLVDKGDGNFVWEHGGKLEKPIAYGSSVSTSEGVLCIGGDDSQKVYTDVFLLSWNPLDKELSKKKMPSLPEPVAYGSAVIHKDTVYLVAGQSGKNSTQLIIRFGPLMLVKVKKVNGNLYQGLPGNLEPFFRWLLKIMDMMIVFMSLVEGNRVLIV